jgi:protein involved in polysaccharide export with SLBB domain
MPRLFFLLLVAILGSAMPIPALAQQASDNDESQQQESDRQQARNNDREDQETAQAANFEPSRVGDEDARGDGDNEEASGRAGRNGALLTVRPPAPNEFEIYAARVAGRELKRFGAGLLLPSARDFARPADATIPPDYRINIGDTVSISLTGSAEGSVERTVDQNRRIFLPSVGEIQIAGVRQGDLKSVLMRAIGTQFRNFRVGVRTTELRGIRVFVTGYAQNPGAFSVSSLDTAFNAILQAGGPASGGSFRTAKLVRGGAEVADIDLYDILINGNRSQDFVLENEDVIVIPPAFPQFAVWGSVQREAIFELTQGETIADALRFAGGMNELADQSRLVLYRAQPDAAPGPQVIDAAAFATTMLRPGDILQVLPQNNLIQPIDQQSVLVRIEGEVRKPGNYYVAPGTPLSEVVAKAGGLTALAYPFGIEFKRQSVVVQQRRSFEEALNLFELTLATAPLTANNSLDQGRQQSQIAAARATLSVLREAEPDGRLVLDIEPDAQSLPGGVLLENGDRIVVPARPTSIGVFGAVYRPASFQIGRRGPLRIKEYVEQAGGTVRSADKGNIFVVRANGSVLTRDNGAMNERALPGDVVFVPIKTNRGDLLSRIAQVSSILFQFGLAAATVAAIN